MEPPSDTDFEINLKKNNSLSEGNFECNVCEKRYKRKSTLPRHINTIHEVNKVMKLKFENENLELKIKMYCNQIKFLKRLILVQEHTIRYRSTVGIPNPISQIPFSTKSG